MPGAFARPPDPLPGPRRAHPAHERIHVLVAKRADVEQPGVSWSWADRQEMFVPPSSTAVSRMSGLGSDVMPNDPHGDLTIDVRQYGARGDGVHDDTDAIQQAFTAASYGHLGTTVFLPPGAYKISRMLTLADATGLVVKGSGGRTRNTSNAWPFGMGK